MSREAVRSNERSAARLQLVGSGGENPEVSATSRFHDDVWDFSSEDRNPSRGPSEKRICWSFSTPDGGLFTDPRFRCLLTASKQFIYALRWRPIDSVPFAASALPSMFQRTKRFIDHLVGYPTPVLRFKDVLPHHFQDYVGALLSSGLRPSYKYHCIAVLQKIFHYRGVMKDGLTVDPLEGESARSMAGYSDAAALESQTEMIPDEILGPLVRASLEYVESFADYLLDACEAVEDIRKRERWFEGLSRRFVRNHVPFAYGLEGTKFEKGLRSVRHLNIELNYLQTACFVLIAFATGMRVSELLSLRKGCCEIQKAAGQPDLVWLRSRVFKMQGVPNGRSAKWLGGPVCAKAVRVLERLGRRVRQRMKVGYLWMPIPAIRSRGRGVRLWLKASG